MLDRFKRIIEQVDIEPGAAQEPGGGWSGDAGSGRSFDDAATEAAVSFRGQSWRDGSLERSARRDSPNHQQQQHHQIYYDPEQFHPETAVQRGDGFGTRNVVDLRGTPLSRALEERPDGAAAGIVAVGCHRGGAVSGGGDFDADATPRGVTSNPSGAVRGSVQQHAGSPQPAISALRDAGAGGGFDATSMRPAHPLAQHPSSSSFSSSVAVDTADARLRQRIAAMEVALANAQYERQQLQVALEDAVAHSGHAASRRDPVRHQTAGRAGGDVSRVASDLLTDFGGGGSADGAASTDAAGALALRASLAESVARCDVLSRDFQHRVVELEFEMMQLRQQKDDLETALDQARASNAAAPPPTTLAVRDHTSVTIDGDGGANDKPAPEAREQQQDLEMELLVARAKVLDLQRNSDKMQRGAAEALERANARERALQQDLSHVQAELDESRRRLAETQRPVEEQMEAQLRNAPVFARIQQTAWGSFVTSVASRVDRLGIRSGRFLSAHAAVRVAFVVYLVLLHVYVFHLFAAVLHAMPATGNDVHAHVASLHRAP